MTDFYVSAEAYKELQKKLAFLKSDKRAEVAEKIAHARSYGDLSENSEYESAKEEQRFLEIEITELEDKLSNAKLIKKSDRTDVVSLGCKVTVFDIDFKEEIEFTITGMAESNPAKNLISNASPIGKALIGKKKGEEAIALTPAGKLRLKILNIKN